MNCHRRRFVGKLNKSWAVLIKGNEMLSILSIYRLTFWVGWNKSKEIYFLSPYMILNFLQNTPTLHSFLEKGRKGGKFSEITQLWLMDKSIIYVDSLPAGTVTFSIVSVNSGSSVITARDKRWFIGINNM